MRYPILTLEVDDKGITFITLSHVPGCECGEGPRTYILPPAAAIAVIEGTGRVIAASGQREVVAPEFKRPSELDDPDRKAA